MRIVAGWCRVSCWLLLVWSMHGPWRQLGGIVDERLRWYERTGISLALWTGLVVGDSVREAPALRRRIALWPPAIAITAAAVWLHCSGRPWEATCVACVLVAYVAGIDISSEGRRLLDGRSPQDDLSALGAGPDTDRAPNSEISSRVRSSRPPE